MEEFVKKWIHLDNSIKEHTSIIKKVKEERDALTPSILNHMVSNNIDAIRLSDTDTLYCKKQIQLGSINKEYIQEILNSFFNQPHTSEPTKLAEETTNAILNNRESNEKICLRRKSK